MCEKVNMFNNQYTYTVNLLGNGNTNRFSENMHYTADTVQVENEAALPPCLLWIQCWDYFIFLNLSDWLYN